MTGRPPTRAAVARRLTHYLLPIYTVVLLTFLFAPIAVMIAFSFNDPAGRQNITWQGFTIGTTSTCGAGSQITGPMITSLAVAAISTLVATAFGTMIALALTRYDFRGRGALNLFIFIPMTAPEIILGASLLTLWISFGVERGFSRSWSPTSCSTSASWSSPFALASSVQPFARRGGHGPLRQRAARRSGG